MSESFKPKVFVSYTWTSNDYILKVQQFVNRLMSDGIDVLFDQFEMKPGKSLNNYMEKCIHDETVTNVLILLNPEYKNKADNRQGGTGIETQIISSEVYENLDNEKFIPILFDKENKLVKDCIPIYLKDRYRLDLSEPDSYEDMYISIVRTIYKQPAFIKPKIGSKPAWLDDYSALSSSIDIKKIQNLALKGDEAFTVSSCLKMIRNEIKAVDFSNEQINASNFESIYSKTHSIRNNYLNVIAELISFNNLESLITDFFNELDKLILFDTNENITRNSIIRILKHELIIETISILFKHKKYELIGNLISSPYYCNVRGELEDFKDHFYALKHREIYNLDSQLGRKYGDSNHYKLTGIGHYWMSNIPEPLITKDEFCFADVLITNISCAIESDKFSWFALTYVYISNQNNWLKEISAYLKSQKLGQKYYCLFGAKTLAEVKEVIKKIDELDKNHSYRLGYNESFETIELISKYIKFDEIGAIK